MVALGTFGIEGFLLSFYASCHFYTFDAKDKQMAIEHNIQNSLMFSTELEDIIVTGVSSSLTFAIAVGDETIYSTTFTPDADGTIHIYDISSILDSHIPATFADFTFYIGSQTVPVRVFHSYAPVAENACSFLPSFFLSSAMKKKITTTYRIEVLSFYAIDSCEVFVEACYYNGQFNTKRHSLIAAADVTLNEIISLNVSAKRFEDNSLGELISYTVVAGKRRFTFDILDIYTAEPAFLFMNNFGVWETFYFSGTRESIPEIKRSLAYINGKYSLYDIDEQQLFKARTGVLLCGSLAIAEDLSRSKSIFLLDSRGNAGDEVVITDEERKYTNDDNAMPTFSYTYRRCRRKSGLIEVIRPPKLFDKTFDETFD